MDYGGAGEARWSWVAVGILMDRVLDTLMFGSYLVHAMLSPISDLHVYRYVQMLYC
jgi:hypothetical protein